MEDDVEHLGNDLGIGDESVSSKSSDEETQDTSQSSKEAGASTASAPEKDRFKKHTYQTTTMQDYFTKRPKPASPPVTSLHVVNEEETSQRITKLWTDPAKQRDKERRRNAEKKRREFQRSETSKRTERVLGKIVDCQAARTGAIMTEAEGRAAVLQDVIAILNPPKRSKTAGVEDDSGHLRAQKKTSPEKLFHGEIFASGKRYFTADETLFLFESFCKHHAFDPHKKDDIDAVTLMVTEGGDKCEWSAVAKRIARDHPKEFGAEHPCGDISRQALKHRVRTYVGSLDSSSFVGRPHAIPEAATAMIVTTVTSMVATHAITFTVSLLRPIVLGVIAAAGCAHLLTDGGKGRFNCSRRWLSELFKKHNLRFRKPQSNSRKLPPDWKDKVDDMVLRLLFLAVTYTIPPQLMVNADHTGILHVQVKGSGWFSKTEKQPEMQGYGQKNQFTCVVGTSADGSTLPCQLIFQGSTVRALPNNMQYTPSAIPPAAGGRKKDREAAAAGAKTTKTTASFVPEFDKMEPAVSRKFRGLGALSVTHDHWADLNTSKSWVNDILIPYYKQICEKSGLTVGTQRCILLVDCWWGWLDAEFREWLKKEYPYVLLLFVPACCTPVGQPNDAGIIAILKGDTQVEHSESIF